jgi:molybdate transport system substrate-binding protein
MMRPFRTAASAVGLIGIFAVARPAGAAEIKVAASTAMTEVLQAVLPSFERDTGHKVSVTLLSTADLPVRIKEGLPVDLIVTSPATLDDLVTAGKVVRGTRVDFMRSSVGVAVHAGAPKPDIGTVDGFKKALLAAKSVGISRGPSGAYLMGLVERLGIADEIKAKAVFTQPGQRVGLLVASGQAEIGVQQITELLAMPGIDFVGPLPSAIQTTIVYALARSTSSTEVAAVSALMKFLTSPAVAPVAKRMGLETPRSDN